MMRTSAAVLLILFLPSIDLHAEETRGVFVNLVDKQLTVKVDGQERTFDASAAEVRMGAAQEKANLSRLKEGARLLIHHDGAQANEVIVELSWYEYPGEWIQQGAGVVSKWSAARFGPDAFLSFEFNVLSLASVILVSLICGTVSSLVVSNRMAFFGDALAHCAFAGVGLGLLLHSFGALGIEAVLPVMILFGVVIGVLIAFVREQTNLASDTVIGVFFAGAMGFGAVLLQWIGRGSSFGPEQFLFGSPYTTSGHELVYLIVLLGLTIGFLCWMYNRLVFSSFNPSLACSRNFPVRLSNYLFVILLGLIVNICLKIAGALLINALLILPAAAAGNLSRNLRWFFWLSAGLSLAAGVFGQILSSGLNQGPGGMIVNAGVGLFVLSMLLGHWVRGARATVRPGF